MKRLLIFVGGVLALGTASCTSVVDKQSASADIKGHLFIIGGGERTDLLMGKFVELAGGTEAKILVVPFASATAEETGRTQSEQMLKFGCRTDYIFFEQGEADLEQNLNKLEGVTGIFFSGGDQNRLTRALLNTQFIERIKEIYRQGGVVGGTSAGAAVMSKIMITGSEAVNKDRSNAFPFIKTGNTITTEGFGLLDFAIIDQHFIQRKRENRLIELVIEHQMTGIGIDESTAIIVSGDGSFEVVGHRTVMIFEPRFKAPPRTDENGNLSADGIHLSILLSGDRYEAR